MILKRYETNNGYRCWCCRDGYGDAEWIENNDRLTFEEILEKAYQFNENINGITQLQYENDGTVLYGYYTEFDKAKTEVYVIIGKNRYRIVADNCDSETLSKEEVLSIFSKQE